jgi:hypothetical protein
LGEDLAVTDLRVAGETAQGAFEMGNRGYVATKSGDYIRNAYPKLEQALCDLDGGSCAKVALLIEVLNPDLKGKVQPIAEQVDAQFGYTKPEKPGCEWRCSIGN